MNKGKILYARKDGVCFIKLVGSVKYTVSSGFDELINDLSLDETINDVVLDVNDAQYIDSTNLGLMAKVARLVMQKFQKQPVILCANDDIKMLLDSMGFATVFLILCRTETGKLDLHAAPHVAQKREKQTRMILDAHRALMALNEKNRKTFRTVVQALEDEL